MGAPRIRRLSGRARTAHALVLDTEFLIAFENRRRWALALVDQFDRDETTRMVVPAGVVAQAYRDPPRQVQLNVLLRHPRTLVVPLTHEAARGIGVLCAHARTSDIVDASVVLTAQTFGARIAMTDPDDLRRLDPDVQLVLAP